MRDVCGQVLDSSRGLGMTGERGVGGETVHNAFFDRRFRKEERA